MACLTVATLQDIYGEHAEAQRPRYQEAIAAFVSMYGSDGPPVRVFRAPGRVNLIGEHTDYNHGYVMPVALDKDILLVARPRFDTTMHIRNIEEEEFPAFSFSMSSDIPPETPGHWGNYIKAAAQALAQRLPGQDWQGMEGLLVGQPPEGLPRQVGLSSSSAMVVVAALALARFNAVELEGVALAHFCAEAEWYVGTRGGIMDHFIAVLGRRAHALFLDCRPYSGDYYKTEHVPLLQGYRLLIADSGVRHQNVKGGYNYRVAACRAAVQLLKPDFPAITHLRDVQGIPWKTLVSKLPEQATVGDLKSQGVSLEDIPGLTDEAVLKIRARCRHVWTENERVLSAVRALRAKDAVTLGRLLNDAHASARDDYEISCPELEHLVQAAREVDGVLGARLTGAGWGGCIVAVVHKDAVSTFKTYVPSRYKELAGIETQIFACRASPGAREVEVQAQWRHPELAEGSKHSGVILSAAEGSTSTEA